MKLTRIQGNTWVAEGIEYIPFYCTDSSSCVLLDSGLPEETQDLESSLLKAGLVPSGILCTHAHVDHCAGNSYFQKKYRLPVALTPEEAGMCVSVLTLKCYFLLLSPQTVARDYGCMVHTPDLLVPEEDGPFSIGGAQFEILHTPGHSAGHISIITPDGVCCAGDALLSRELMNSRLPYGLSHEQAAKSREKLRRCGADMFVMSHRGVCPGAEIEDLVDQNRDLICRLEDRIVSLIPEPMTMSQVTAAVCRDLHLLSHRPTRALRFERNIRFFLEHLTDTGRLEMVCRDGTVFYQKPGYSSAGPHSC